MGLRIEGSTVFIKLPLDEPRPSKTGKTLLIASTRGVQRSTAFFKGKVVSFVVNAFIWADGLKANDAKNKEARKHREDDDEEEEDY